MAYTGGGAYSNNEATISAQGSLLNTLHDKFNSREEDLNAFTSKRNIILLVDLSQDLFVFGGKKGVKVIKNNEVIKEYNNEVFVSKGQLFVGNKFDGEDSGDFGSLDGVWGNIEIKYASKGEDYLLQIGNNNALFSGVEIDYKFEQIGVS
jgi:hypothetical protein